MGKPNILFKFIVSTILIAIFVYLFVTYFDISKISTIIKSANLLMLLSALVVYYSSFIIRALRWKKLLESIEVKEKFSHVLYAIFICFFFNSLIPLRFGDLYRTYLLKRKRSIPVSKTLGTLFIEKFIDLTFLVIMLLTIGLFLLKAELIRSTKYLMASSIFLVAIFITITILIFLFGDKKFFFIPRRLTNMVVNFRKVLYNCANARIMIPVIIFTLIDWSFAFLLFYLVVLSVGIKLPIILIIFVVSAQNILTTIPLTPAGVGFVEFGVAGMLMLIGLEKNLSISIALLDRFIGYWSLIIIGLLVYIFVKADKIFKTNDNF